ncbi:unnamed protein product [marine sediment metagenome]|uniref:Uncharacterized protein n=1 Tax=marine sediment metagenome TaxID=412755 RepID=X1CU20_9ZZZZ
MKVLKRILYVILILTVLSNAFVHSNEIVETYLNTIQTIFNSTVISMQENNIKSITNKLEKQVNKIKSLYNRILVLEERKPIVMNRNKVERQV